MPSLFPYSIIRPSQQILMEAVSKALESGNGLVLDAPTGIGKTAGVLAPTLEFALAHNKTVFFLTARHTQHRLVIETAREIGHRHGTKIIVSDLLGKKHMCAQDGVEHFKGNEFNDHCKRLRENDMCSFYTNFRHGQNISTRAKALTNQIAGQKALHTHELVSIAKANGLCPYEVGGQVGAMANLVVCDYSLLFHPSMRTSLLSRMKKDLGNAIIIIDEAHNLAGRLRDMMSQRTSNLSLRRATKEASKLGQEDLAARITEFANELEEVAGSLERERQISKEEINDIAGDIEEFRTELDKAAALVRESAEHSFLGALSEFLEAWQQEGEGFARIIEKQRGRQEIIISVRMRALDPALWTAPVISEAHCAIAMSGTLSPTFMHRDLLGFDEDCVQLALPNPFPPENRRTIIVPGVTTKYDQRGEPMYAKIAAHCLEITNRVPGNVALFFPSYQMRDEIFRRIHPGLKKRPFIEASEFTNKERAAFLEDFKRSAPNAVLVGVVGGSFSEGVDIENNLLKAVAVIGVPLDVPDLETKALIAYYDHKFGRGWEYGYLIPAINKAIQSAGRCIRSENDRGAILMLDERYAWPAYKKYFPPSWSVKLTREVGKELAEFFAAGLPRIDSL